ncbi:hypothetical protein CLH39_01920 [Alcaligenes faecalis]|uniref:O-antigen ligase family protein n=1 Tax=Alcaligenes faecalis TaxID=511 RepID=UPI0019331BA3|nr:O-antigen ligase family protein [Alcaligenes faecalis]QRF89064.1 hypothetical protein CLH39_01920 [Alcaligenes faecalis]
MMQNKSSVYTLIFFAIVLLTPFGNLFTQSTVLGIYGAFGPSFIVPFFIAWYFFTNKQINKAFLLSCAYMAIISCLYLITLHPQFPMNYIYKKGITFSIIYFSLFSLFLFPLMTKRTIATSTALALVICIFSIYFLSENTLLNFLPYDQSRPRGYMQEPSHFALISGTLATLGFAFSTKHYQQFLFFSAGLFLCYLSHSKAGILFYIGAFSFYFTIQLWSINSKAIKYGFLIIFLIGLAAAFYIFYPIIHAGFTADIERFTSTATRSSSLVSVFMILATHPLGVGFFSYSDLLVQIIPSTTEFMMQRFPLLNYEEFYGYFLWSENSHISTKSLFFDFLVFAGLPFIALIFYYAKTIFSLLWISKKFHYLPCLLFVLMSLFIWNTGISFYICFLALSQIYGYLQQQIR